MKSMIISEFKAKCIGVLKAAQHDGESITITWHGHPIALVEPILDKASPRKLGALKGMMQIKGDIVHADSTADWEIDQ